MTDLKGAAATLTANEGGIGAGNSIETELTSVGFTATGAVELNELAAGTTLSVSGTTSGDVAISTAAGTLTVGGAINAGAADITLTAGGGASDVEVNGALQTDEGDISITAGNCSSTAP